MSDVINSPEHYVKNSVMLQPIELSNRLDGSLSQAVQYVVRRNHKNTALENLGKARFELKWCLENLFGTEDYRFTCVSESRFKVYVEIFVAHSKDAFFREFLQELFLGTGDGLNLNLMAAIGKLDGEIERLKAQEGQGKAGDHLKDIGEDKRN